MEKAVLGVATGGLTEGGLGAELFPIREEGFADEWTNPSGASRKVIKLEALRGTGCSHGAKGAMGNGAGEPLRIDWAMGEVIFLAFVSQQRKR